MIGVLPKNPRHGAQHRSLAMAGSISGGRGIRTHEDGVGPALELFKSSPFGLSGSPPSLLSLS